MLLQVARFPPFPAWIMFHWVYMCVRAVYVCLRVSYSLSTPLWMDSWVFSMCWLLRIRLQWARECSFFFKRVILFPLDVYPEVGLLSYVMVLLLVFWDSLCYFHSGYTRLNSHQECTRCPFLPCPHQHFSLAFFDETVLADVRWYLTVALVCISLMTSDVELFLSSCWTFVYLLWKMSAPLILKLDCLGFLLFFLL